MFGLSILFAISISSCKQETAPQESTYINKVLPTIGIIIFDAVITNEILAPLDVFSKHTAKGEKSFLTSFSSQLNKEPIKPKRACTCCLTFPFDNTPDLDVLVIPSSYESAKQYKDPAAGWFCKSTIRSIGLCGYPLCRCVYLGCFRESRQ